ncbi:hypothetical protein D3C80_1191350 [compost metagenome]
MHGLGPVDAHGQTEAVGIEVVDNLFVEQGRVGGHHELDALARFKETLLAVIDHVLDQLAVAQWLATEKHHGIAGLVR